MAQREARYGRELQRKLEEIGDYSSVARYLSKYGNLRTRLGYITALSLYLRWLRKEGVGLNPDELVKDNLQRVYGSSPTDVESKRRHTDLLNQYVNEVLKGRKSDSHRKITAAAVTMFYKRNDSPLFGDFQVAVGRPVKAPPALPADEIRKVLKGLPLAQRLPLLLVWQSSIEIHRILELTWADVDLTRLPSPFEILGRKGHRRPYGTFFGRDSIEGLRAWRTQWKTLAHADPTEKDLVFIGKGNQPADEQWINRRFKNQAVAMHKEGLVKTGDPRSWHSHALRASFETEAAHAGVKGEIRDYFMGHVRGVQWLYNHRDELHPEDLEKEYVKLEPFVSLEPDEATLQNEFAEKEKTLVSRVERAEALLEELRTELGVARTAPPQSAR